MLVLAAGASAFTTQNSFNVASRSVGGIRMMATQDELKKQVGYKAIDDYVTSGMVVGLGTGSTAAFAVERLGELMASASSRTSWPSPPPCAPRSRRSPSASPGHPGHPLRPGRGHRRRPARWTPS
ncbi:unnamed protein product [Heterosigma akashiwo]